MSGFRPSSGPSPERMESVWESLARLEAVRREARVQSALFSLGASRIPTDVTKPDSLLDAATNVAEATDAFMHASECADEIERSRREYLQEGIPSEQLELAMLQAWARERWNASSDPHVSLLLHWLRSPWDDAHDLPVSIVQMIGRINAGGERPSD